MADYTIPEGSRNLQPGIRLVATYKKTDLVCDVVETPDGVRFRFNGKDHKSPSAAGAAAIGGGACNGWRFWHIEGQEPPKREPKPKAEKAPKAPKEPKGKTSRNIKKARNQGDHGPDGNTLYYCSACQMGFIHPTADGAPKACPEGHAANMPDEVPMADAPTTIAPDGSADRVSEGPDGEGSLVEILDLDEI